MAVESAPARPSRGLGLPLPGGFEERHSAGAIALASVDRLVNTLLHHVSWLLVYLAGCLTTKVLVSNNIAFTTTPSVQADDVFSACRNKFSGISLTCDSCSKRRELSMGNWGSTRTADIGGGMSSSSDAAPQDSSLFLAEGALTQNA